MSQLNSGDVFAGRYKVLKFCGEGSLGSSYICEDFETENSRVVVKLISPKFTSAPGFTNSYVMFTKSAMQIKLPGIVMVKDVDSFSDVWYTVTEYIEGINLKSWLQNALSFEERVIAGLELLKKLGKTLSGLHEVGHYACLKPQNVFIHDNQVRLGDFWIAGFIPIQEYEANLAARQYLPYMSPEIKDNWSKLGPLSDFYSIGAIMYEIFTGKSPVGKIKKPSECSKLYTPAVDAIVLKFIATDPAARPQNFQELNESINSLLSGFIPSRPAVSAPRRRSEDSIASVLEKSPVVETPELPEESVTETSVIVEEDPEPETPVQVEEDPEPAVVEEEPLPAEDLEEEVFDLDEDSLEDDDDSETVIINKEDLQELETRSAETVETDNESDTRALPGLPAEPEVEDLGESGIESDDLENAIEKLEDEPASSTAQADSILEESVEHEEPVVEQTKEINEQVVPPGYEPPEESNSDNENEDQASPDHFGSEDKKSSSEPRMPEVIEETAEVEPVFEPQDKDVEILQTRAIAEEILPPANKQKEKYQDRVVRKKTETDDEEFDPPPMPTSIKVAMIILGLIIIGGSVFLGLNYQIPW